MSHEPHGLPDPIDRHAPTVRPPRRTVMRQRWSRLLFLHWDVPAAALRPLIPEGLDLDLYEGRAYVGLVPFTMSGIRPVGMPPAPWLSRFHETNLRTYVHRRGRDPGVWFFSLDAANPVAVIAARAWYHLPYHDARMTLAVTPPVPGTDLEAISYASERRWPGPLPASTAIRCRPHGPVRTASPGTLDAFLIERYLLYASRGDRLYRGQVHHVPYPIRSADVLALDESLTSAAGIVRPETSPLAHYAPGVDVEVFALQRI